MAKHISTIFSLFIFFQFYASASSIPFVDNLCYTKTESSQIKVSTLFNPEILTFGEKLKFKDSNSIVKISKYLSSYDYVKDQEYLDYNNIVPAYQNIPYLIRSNSLGVTSQYTITSQGSLGWYGSVFIKNPEMVNDNSIYTEDSRNRVGVKFVPRSHGDKRWLTKFERYKTNGLLEKYVWVKPTNEFIQKFISIGYTVNASTQSSIVISKETTTISWDLINKTQVVQYNDDTGSLTSQVVKTYNYNSQFGVSILADMQMEEFSSFTSGDCYSEVITIVFSEYSNQCNIVEARDGRQNAFIEIKELKVFPNPAMNDLAITIPKVVNGMISIYNSVGAVLYTAKIVDSSEQLSIDISRYPSGSYIVKLNSDDNHYHSKFIKQ